SRALASASVRAASQTSTEPASSDVSHPSKIADASLIAVSWSALPIRELQAATSAHAHPEPIDQSVERERRGDAGFLGGHPGGISLRGQHNVNNHMRQGKHRLGISRWS